MEHVQLCSAASFICLGHDHIIWEKDTVGEVDDPDGPIFREEEIAKGDVKDQHVFLVAPRNHIHNLRYPSLLLDELYLFETVHILLQ